MADYYVFATRRRARTCLRVVNRALAASQESSRKNGKQKTLRWAKEPVQLASGEWGIPAVGPRQLPAMNEHPEFAVWHRDRLSPAVRSLTPDDFPAPDPE